MSYQRLIYHLVISTHMREGTIEKSHERELYTYMLGTMRNLGAHVYRIGGMPDHMHIILSIPAKTAISDFVRDLKTAASVWMKNSPSFPRWRGWGDGYGVFSCSFNDLTAVVDYVKNQKIHHRKTSFDDEYKQLLVQHNIPFNEIYLDGRKLGKASQ